MKNSELKMLIREVVKEAMSEFAPHGVAETDGLEEGIPPEVRKSAEKAGGEPTDYAKAFRKYYAQTGDVKEARRMVKEMWLQTATNKKNEVDDMSQDDVEMDQDAEHDETDMSNPEENKEVELAKQIKSLADQLLAMHGVGAEDEEGMEDGKGMEGGEDEMETPEEPEADDNVERKEKIVEKRKKKKKYKK